MTSPRRARAAALTPALFLTAVALTACTSAKTTPPAPSVTTEVITPPPSTVAPASGSPIPPTAAVTETDGTCPYITTQVAADTEGNRIGRTTVVSTTPVGCNFYFQYGDNHRTLEIGVQNFATADDAYNAAINQAKAADPKAQGEAGFVTGLDAVFFQTTFYAPDGNTDWACNFAKGTNMITVKTDQTRSSQNARNIATIIAPVI